jgi:hypothetical protein
MINVNPAWGLVAALLVRLANIVCMLALGPIYTYILSQRLGQPLMDAARLERLM